MRIYNLGEPLNEPLLLAEVRDHLRIDNSDEDAYLGALITAARIYAESWTGLHLIDQSLKVTLDQWPGETRGQWWSGLATGPLSGLFGDRTSFRLAVAPVSLISEIRTLDGLGGAILWDSAQYRLVTGVDPVLTLASGASWPKPGQKTAGIEIALTAGFGPNWNSVPAAIRQAMLMIVARLYAARGDSPAEAMRTTGAAALLAPFRRVKL